MGVWILFLTSCIGLFSVDRSGGIVRYESGRAHTAYGHFQVGRLPRPWQGPKLQLKNLVFYNNDIAATIVTNAMCGPKFVDSPLPRLAGDMFLRFEGVKTERGKKFSLDGREAFRLRGQGRIDGVPTRMEAVTLKKDFCVYDLVYFSSPENFSKGLEDFKGYVNGFQAR